MDEKSGKDMKREEKGQGDERGDGKKGKESG